jgi:hypothetical protein
MKKKENEERKKKKENEERKKKKENKEPANLGGLILGLG